MNSSVFYFIAFFSFSLLVCNYGCSSICNKSQISLHILIVIIKLNAKFYLIASSYVCKLVGSIKLNYFFKN